MEWRMNGWRMDDGPLEGWMDGWTDGWTDKVVIPALHSKVAPLLLLAVESQYQRVFTWKFISPTHCPSRSRHSSHAAETPTLQQRWHGYLRPESGVKKTFSWLYENQWAPFSFKKVGVGRWYGGRLFIILRLPTDGLKTGIESRTSLTLRILISGSENEDVPSKGRDGGGGESRCASRPSWLWSGHQPGVSKQREEEKTTRLLQLAHV